MLFKSGIKKISQLSTALALFFKYVYLFTYFMCVSVLPRHVYMYTTCVPGTGRGHKEASDGQKLEMQRVVSYHVSAGKQTWALCKCTKCS